HLWELFCLVASRSVSPAILQRRHSSAACNSSIGIRDRAARLISTLAMAAQFGPQNRNNPDFRFSLPILLNWYGRRFRYYSHTAGSRCRLLRHRPAQFRSVCHGRGETMRQRFIALLATTALFAAVTGHALAHENLPL